MSLIFRGKAIDTVSSDIVEEIESMTYLYSFPPYPLPAKARVQALIYWDPVYNIDDAEIIIANSNGDQIGGREDIEIIKLARYKGYISWDCSDQVSGVYFIYIKHGTGIRTIKVIITR